MKVKSLGSSYIWVKRRRQWQVGDLGLQAAGHRNPREGRQVYVRAFQPTYPQKRTVLAISEANLTLSLFS